MQVRRRLVRVGLLTGVFLFIVLSSWTEVTQLVQSYRFRAAKPVFAPESSAGPFLELAVSDERLIDQINEQRQQSGVDLLEAQPELAAVAQAVLDEAVAQGVPLDDESLGERVQIVLRDRGFRAELISKLTFEGQVSADQQARSTITPDLLSTAYAQIGIGRVQSTSLVGESIPVTDLSLFILLASPLEPLSVERQLSMQPSVASPTGGRTPQSSIPPAPAVPELSDDEVIAALNAYRRSHSREPLRVNPHLCTYAQKRVGDLVAFGGLDGHAGFRADFAQSEPPIGIREYDKPSIGENLAHQHCRNMQTGEPFFAETGTALIEWCFDSSTAGHREAQLSRKFSDVCVRHGERMYVVIFGGDV